MRAYENTLKRRVSWEKKYQRKKSQAESFLFWNLLKTTSEWLKNSPVIPLSS